MLGLCEELGVNERLYADKHTRAHIMQTFGSDVLEPELCVVMVSTVVMPRATLAGAASMLIQKETQERMTMRREGMYIWIR